MTTFRKIIKWIGISLAGVVILAIVVHIVLNITFGAQLRHKIRELKAQGRPMTMLEITPLSVPEDKNAAMLYNKVFALMTSGEGGEPYIPNKNKGKNNKIVTAIEEVESFLDISKWTEEQREKIPKLINSQEMQEIYTLLKEASKRLRCNFNLEYEKGVNMSIHHIRMIRSAVSLLLVKVRLEAESGNVARAFDTLLISLRMTNHIREEPVLISQMLRIFCDRLIIESIKGILDKDNISQEKARSVIAELIKHTGSEPFKKGIAGERIICGKEYQKILDGKYSMREFRTFFSGGDFPKLFYLLPTLPFRSLLKKDFTTFLTYISETEDLFGMPYYEGVIKGKEIELMLKKSPDYLLAKVITFAFTNIREKTALHEADIQLCRVGLGLVVYKAENGIYPELLNELTPDILDEIPLDPFTGKSLAYRKLTSGFILYSLGPNLKDDEGIQRATRKTEKAYTDYDVVFKCKG